MHNAGEKQAIHKFIHFLFHFRLILLIYVLESGSGEDGVIDNFCFVLEPIQYIKKTFYQLFASLFCFLFHSFLPILEYHTLKSSLNSDKHCRLSTFCLPHPPSVIILAGYVYQLCVLAIWKISGFNSSRFLFLGFLYSNKLLVCLWYSASISGKCLTILVDIVNQP